MYKKPAKSLINVDNPVYLRAEPPVYRKRPSVLTVNTHFRKSYKACF
jgi:hypothetical protein